MYSRARKRPPKVAPIKTTRPDGSTSAASAKNFERSARQKAQRTWKARYKRYLNSPKWRALREAVLERDNHKCRFCPSRKNLEVHHLTYEHIFNEQLEELVTTCEACHEHIHRKRLGPHKEKKPYTYRKRKAKKG